MAESLLLKHQLLISSRARRRAPNLNTFDRLLLGLGSLFVPPSRIPKLAVILKPRTLFKFHEALKKCKYQWLFSSGGHRRPGPKGPSKELIDAIVEIKRRNPRVGCTRIAPKVATSTRRKRVSIARMLTLGLPLFAVLMSSRDVGAIESPRQLANYCGTVEKNTKGTGRQVRIPNTKEALLCWGYMQSIQDLSRLADEGGGRIIGSCPPEQGTLLQLIHSFVVYARSHLDDLRGNTAVAVIKALREAYPCSQTNEVSPDPINR